MLENVLLAKKRTRKEETHGDTDRHKKEEKEN